jgi:hypothetical protein
VTSINSDIRSTYQERPMQDLQPANSNPAHSSMTGLLLRSFWMVFGVLGLLAIGGGLWARSGDSVALWSVLFWLDVGLIVAARYVDIRYFHGETVESKPADLGHWARHTLGLVPSALAFWLVLLWVGGQA